MTGLPSTTAERGSLTTVIRWETYPIVAICQRREIVRDRLRTSYDPLKPTISDLHRGSGFRAANSLLRRSLPNRSAIDYMNAPKIHEEESRCQQ